LSKNVSPTTSKTPRLSRGENSNSRSNLSTNSCSRVFFLLEDSLPLTETDDYHNKSSGFELSQNYPNPFNPSTTIKYQIPASSFVTLKVFDLLGRVVSTLVNEELKTGSYEATWDASRSSSGVYFYRLDTGNFIQTKKMVMIK
jgi:hypothetical protein